MKLILMGTPEFVPAIFEELSHAHEIVAVFTRPPKPAGRKKILTKSPVHLWGKVRGFAVETDINQIHKYNADMAIVISYGVILRPDVLDKMPFVNTHFSLLPKYRGASPFQTAILNGDKTSGVCLMKIDTGLDTGDIYMCREFSIGQNDMTADVIKTAGELTIKMLLEFLSMPNKFPPVPQIGVPTYTHKFTGADEIIDWAQSPEQIHNLVRAIGGRTKINGLDVKILKTKILDGQLIIEKIQPSGKNPMDWKSFVNGLRGAELVFGK